MKRVMSLLISGIILLTSLSNTIAAITSVEKENEFKFATELDNLGLFQGTENGYELGRRPTRLEGIVMLIRLLGKEDEAKKASKTMTIFKDVPTWGIQYVNYANETGLALGKGYGTFGASELLNVNDFTTFVLRALGYDDRRGDFEWYKAVEKGTAVGLFDQESNYVKTNTFTRGSMVTLSHHALSTSLNNRNIILADYLKQEQENNKNIEGISVSINDYIKAGETDYTQAIIRANKYLNSIGGGTLVFKEGSYLIKPSKIFIPSNVHWMGFGDARLYTKEKSTYNVLISTQPKAKNIAIKNIVFDQSNDSKLTPNVKTLGGCFILHVSNSDQIVIEDCTFYTYGVCAVLVQSNYANQTKEVTVRNNKAFFQRKTNVFYDVSVFNIDGRKITVEGNTVKSLKVDNIKDWKARCAFEVHAPNGNVNKNVSTDCEVGIIHCYWPALWEKYEAGYSGIININDNTIEGAIVGISMWGATTLPGVITKNLNIKNNTIDMHVDDYYAPSQGIAFVDGTIGNSGFKNVRIEGNNITVTAEPNIDIGTRMNLLVPGKDVGAIFCNTKNTMDGLVVTNNLVKGFPYTFLNLYRRNNSGEKLVHKNITVYNNNIRNSGYSHTYGNTFEALFNIGRSSNVDIHDNTILKDQKTYIKLLNQLDMVDQINFNN